MNVPPVVVIAIGNPSRGDDALGPLLSERLAAWVKGEGRAQEVELIDDFQLQVEHAMDLQGRRLVLFVDAGVGTPAPYDLEPLRPTDDFGHTTHAISPGAVLHVYTQTLGGDPPAAFVLAIRGESFELGADLTEGARVHLEAAFTVATRLLSNPDPEYWRSCASRPPAASR